MDQDLLDALRNPEPFRPKASETSQQNGSYVQRMERIKKEWIQYASLRVVSMQSAKDSRFCDLYQIEIDRTNPYEPPPDTNKIIVFFKWQARTKKGMLDDRITTRTVEKYWDELRREIRRHTGHSYGKLEVEKIKKVGIPPMFDK